MHRSLRCLALAGLCMALALGRVVAEEKKSGSSDEDFVVKASAAGLAEVNLSRLAMDRAAAEGVKQFAKHMVEDHSKANEQLLAVANAKKLRPALDMDAKHKEIFTRLSSLRGSDFDREYMTAMVKDHEEAVALFSDAARGARDMDVKAFAEKTLPTIKHHLEMARTQANSGRGK